MSKADRTPPIEAAVLSDPGGRRRNEDTAYNCEEMVEAEQLASRGRLYIVADGTGGQAGGQTASRRAVDVVEEYYYDADGDPGEDLKAAVEEAHQELYARAQRRPAWARMSTTFVGAVLYQGTLYVAHVGDSRAYLIRDGQARLLTRDHVWLEDDENYGALTRWLGGEGKPEVEVDLTTESLQEGDVIVLCSDGLTDVVDGEDIQQIVTRYPASKAAHRLVALAKQRGTADNVSVAVIRYGGKPTAPAGRALWAWAGLAFLALTAVVLAVVLLRPGKEVGGNGGPVRGDDQTRGTVPAATPVPPTPTLSSVIKVEKTPTLAGASAPTATASPTDRDDAPGLESRGSEPPPSKASHASRCAKYIGVSAKTVVAFGSRPTASSIATASAECPAA